MDTDSNVFTETHGTPPTNTHTHIFAQSDGGCRHKGKSATGYAIRTYDTNTTTTTLITTGGNLINTNLSSLTVEAHALDELTERITQWMHGTTNHYNSTNTRNPQLARSTQ